ncbi:MFS transporter [Longispora fulva]|uniref:MFS family permease n=1 Tax=Longispora fulva TaxID=619741 RepID=A0A8J7KR95_9ACTN|nr:MFS transporter [Longispora fulva]MBG6138312.1 MFS family permease [Longispora fulva]
MLINRDYRRLWFGQAVSLVGNTVFDTSLLLWVGAVLLKGRSYAPAVSSALLAVIAAVTILVAPVAGVLADRWDKRRTMLRTELLRCVLIAGLTVLSALPAGVVPVWGTLTVIALTVVATTAAAQFFGPSRFVLIGDVVPSAHRGRASSYGQAASAMATIIGPPLAAPLLITAGVPWALGVNAASFLVSFMAIRSIRTPHPPSEPSRARPAAKSGVGAELLVGLRLVGAHRVLRAVLITGLIVMLGAGTLGALDVYFVSENLHAAPKWLGLLGAASGAGFLIGGLTSGFLGDRFGHTRIFTIALMTAAGAFLLYSRLGAITPAVAAIALFSVAAGTVETVTTPVLLGAVPRDHLGRVISVFAPTYKLASLISIAAAGAIVGAFPAGAHATVAGVAFGRIDTVFTATALLLLAGGVHAALALRGTHQQSLANND